jgi:hypothetical protein
MNQNGVTREICPRRSSRLAPLVTSPDRLRDRSSGAGPHHWDGGCARLSIVNYARLDTWSLPMGLKVNEKGNSSQLSESFHKFVVRVYME